MIFLFERLNVYKRALDYANKVIHLTQGFPSEFIFLRDQFRRAATSICLNIAEGNGRSYPKERSNYFVIARGSSCECVPIIDLCVRNQLIRREARLELRGETHKIIALLNGLIKRTRADAQEGKQ